MTPLSKDRVHRVWVNGYLLEGHDVLCDVCLSYQEDDMLMASFQRYRHEWRNYVISTAHTVLLVGAGCWMFEEHFVDCSGAPEEGEACCQVSNRHHMELPAEFVPVMMRYNGLPGKLREEVEGVHGIRCFNPATTDH